MSQENEYFWSVSSSSLSVERTESTSALLPFERHPEGLLAAASSPSFVDGEKAQASDILQSGGRD